MWKDTAEISSNLTLFRSIESDASRLLIKAGAIPDAGEGIPVGADGAETLLSFDVQVKDPSQRVVIDLNPGTGDQRDGLIGRNLDIFDKSNSVIHSFASKIYLEALEPENDSVGSYDIVMQATDLSGEQVSQTLSLVIANRNDAPLIDDDGEAQSQLLIQWLTKKRVEGEREEKSFSLFSDPDLLVDPNEQLTYRLIPGSGEKETESLALPNSIKIEQAKDGTVVLDLIPPRGITSVIEQQFKLLASDDDGLSTESDWFTVAFTPIAEATLLTQGNQEKPLEATQLSNAAQKNTALDLQSALDLNAVTLTDPAGDEVVFKLLVQQPQAELSLANSNQSNASFLKQESVKEGTLFTINLQELTKASGKPTGSLEGLELRIPELKVLPRGLSPSIQAGIPLQIWSETRVKGDSEKNFNVAESDRSTLWVPIENTRPVLHTQPALTKIDESFFASENFNPETPLVELPELFRDDDPAETLEWELETPKALKGLVELDSASGQSQIRQWN